LGCGAACTWNVFPTRKTTTKINETTFSLNILTPLRAKDFVGEMNPCESTNKSDQHMIEGHLLEDSPIKIAHQVHKNGWVRYWLAATLPAFAQGSDQLRVAGLCILVM
jgi:ribosomal protein S8